MFETHREPTPRSLWRFLIPGVLIFTAVAALLIFSLVPSHKTRAELPGVVRAGDPDFEWYRQYVDLTHPKIQMGKNFAGNRIVMFSAVIENKGEKMLDVVEVELNFFNYDKLVWSTVRTPIRPEREFYTTPVESLEERGFTLYLEDIPEKWLASHAEMSIHGFRFKPRL